LGKKKKSSGVGGLRSEDVERDIVDASQTGKGTGGKGGTGEKVYLKASGRAIPRALEVGVEMQGEGCVVQIEMGSVRAVDDVQVLRGVEGDVGGEVEETRIRNVSCVTVSIWEK
jgi:ribonuclease P/MRP protein subunit POP7